MIKIVILFLSPIFCFGQWADQIPVPSDTSKMSRTLAWVKELYEPGVRLANDSVMVSAEFKRILKDAQIRKMLFPETYTWEKTIELLNASKFKIAFWYLINLYPQSDKNKELVLKVVITYDKIFEMDKALTSTFYTYSFLDPRISVIKNERPEVTHPEVFESLMSQVKVINTAIQFYRKNPPK